MTKLMRYNCRTSHGFGSSNPRSDCRRSSTAASFISMSENGQTSAKAGPTLSVMQLDPQHCYEALRARDARFDGAFFVAVSSTGIYCRPVCTARLPRRDRCSFYSNAASAERAGYRPCLRCRPELAPGAVHTGGGTRNVGLMFAVLYAAIGDAPERALARATFTCCSRRAPQASSVTEAFYARSDSYHIGKDCIPCRARPTPGELQALLNPIIKRIMKFLTRKGFLIEEQGMTHLTDTDSDLALGSLRAAACTYPCWQSGQRRTSRPSPSSTTCG